MTCRFSLAKTLTLMTGLTLIVSTLTGPAQAQVGSAPKTTIAPTAPAPSIPSDPNRIRVPITTADGVELDGTYYRNPKGGRDAPCVMLVHKYGADRTKIDWVALALKLQESGCAVLTFDLRGHGNSTQLSNPKLFWSVPFNRNGIRGGTAVNQKNSINFADFKPSYFPFLVNDLAAARRFFELKNDAGECNVHSLIIVGAEGGADLGFLFAAAEYGRPYVIGRTALQSNGTTFNAGADIAAGVWLSLSSRPALPGGAPSFELSNWIKNFPMIRDKTPMCFIYGDGDRYSRVDSEAAFKVLTGPMNGTPEKHKLDDLHPIKGTTLAGSALLGQPALAVSDYIVKFCDKVRADRRAVPWTEVKPETNLLDLIMPTRFGFRAP